MSNNLYLKPQAKTAIQVLGTTGAVGYYALTQYRKGKVDIKMLIVWSLVIAVLVFVALHFILKQIPSAERPADVPLGSDDSTNGINSFDPVKFVKPLYDDIYSYGIRDNDPYKSMLNLSNIELKAAYNYWKDKYFDEDGETMTQAIAGELTPVFGDFPALRDQLVSRLKMIGCN